MAHDYPRSRPRRQELAREPSWHIRGRKQRASDRTRCRIVAACNSLCGHHGSELPQPIADLFSEHRNNSFSTTCSFPRASRSSEQGNKHRSRPGAPALPNPFVYSHRFFSNKELSDLQEQFALSREQQAAEAKLHEVALQQTELYRQQLEAERDELARKLSVLLLADPLLREQQPQQPQQTQECKNAILATVDPDDPELTPQQEQQQHQAQRCYYFNLATDDSDHVGDEAVIDYADLAGLEPLPQQGLSLQQDQPPYQPQEGKCFNRATDDSEAHLQNASLVDPELMPQQAQPLQQEQQPQQAQEGFCPNLVTDDVDHGEVDAELHNADLADPELMLLQEQPPQQPHQQRLQERTLPPTVKKARKPRHRRNTLLWDPANLSDPAPQATADALQLTHGSVTFTGYNCGFQPFELLLGHIRQADTRITSDASTFNPVLQSMSNVDLIVYLQQELH